MVLVLKTKKILIKAEVFKSVDQNTIMSVDTIKELVKILDPEEMKYE